MTALEFIKDIEKETGIIPGRLIIHKNVFYDLSNEKKLDYIENSINKNQKFRNLLKGMITGLFTVEEYLEYKKNSSSLNKRMMNIILKRLQDNLQIFKFD